jgi:hypothetical protein
VRREAELIAYTGGGCGGGELSAEAVVAAKPVIMRAVNLIRE